MTETSTEKKTGTNAGTNAGTSTETNTGAGDGTGAGSMAEPEAEAGYGRDRLRADLRELGVRRGSVLLVQASMKAVEPADGGAALITEVLLELLGPAGTLVVPTYTALNSVTSRGHKLAVKDMTPEQAAEYIDALPVFDPFLSPSQEMGVLAEHVRNMSDAVRSTHPHTSFAAVGARAMELMKVHDIDCHLGPDSPLGALYEADADNLFLGLEYNRGCTMIHLAEYHFARERAAEDLPVYRREYKARIASADTSDKWVTFWDLDIDDGHFGRVGAEFDAAMEGTRALRRGMVGAAHSRLVGSRAVVDFAVSWMWRNKGWARGAHDVKCAPSSL